MRQHKFRVGQKVKFYQVMSVNQLRPSEPVASTDSYEITRLLPETGSELQYRIKSTSKGQERVVTESEIG